MKITLAQIVNSEKALTQLLETKLPIKTSYWLSKFVTKIQPDLVIFKEKQNALFKELGEPVKDNPDMLTIKPENMPKFQEEIAKLLEVEVEVEKMDKIKMEDLGDVSIEPKYLTSLEYIIE